MVELQNVLKQFPPLQGHRKSDVCTFFEARILVLLFGNCYYGWGKWQNSFGLFVELWLDVSGFINVNCIELYFSFNDNLMLSWHCDIYGQPHMFVKHL